MKPDDTRHRRGLVAARVCGAFLALYLAFAPGPAVTQELQVIELHYRLADAVIPTLQPLLEPGGFSELKGFPVTRKNTSRAFSELKDADPRPPNIIAGIFQPLSTQPETSVDIVVARLPS